MSSLLQLLPILMAPQAGGAELGSLPPGAPVQLAADSGGPQAGDAGAVRAFDLTWPDDVNLTLEEAPFEVVARFDRPLDEAAFKSFAEAAAAEIADFRWNDTSLVLRAAPGRSLRATVSGRTLHITFVPDTATAEANDENVGDDTERQLAIARAEADAAAGYPDRARRILAELAASNPDDKEIQRRLADAEAAAGALGAAADRYRWIGAEDLAAARIVAQDRGFVTATAIVRDNKQFSQTELVGNAGFRISPTVVLGAALRNFRSHAASVNGPLGIVSDVTSHTTLGEIVGSVQLGLKTRLELKGSAQFDGDVAGARAQFVTGASERQARVLVAYHMPELITPEQAIFGGYISRLGVGGSIRPVSGLYTQLDASVNGYGLAGGGVRSKSVSLAGSAEVILRRGSPSLALSYQLDAEYVGKVKRRSTGVPFIALDDRENHTLQLVSSWSLGKVQVTGAGGWTVDRFGGANGPNANVNAATFIGRAWRMEGSAGVNSISRPGIPGGRNLYFRLSLTRFLG